MPLDERMLLESVTEQVLLGPNRSPSSEMSGRLSLHIQEGACSWPASEIKRPQLLLGQQERRKHHRDQRPQKEKNSVTLVLVPANCVRASKLRLGGNPRPAGDSRWGRRCASGRQPVFGLLFGVWPGKTRLASKARFTSRIRTIIHQQTTSHQQIHSPPANRRPASKRVPRMPLATVGRCQRENKQALTALRRRR